MLCKILWQKVHGCYAPSATTDTAVLDANSLLRHVVHYSLSNSSLADKIMTSVRDTIRTYPFLIKDMNKQVRIIQGVEEGVYSWITTNYLSGKFGVSVTLLLLFVLLS
jgi:hypothetical protein